MPGITIEDQLVTLSRAELDTFPHGIIQLDRSGRILYYNEAEATLARRSVQETLGLNFFRDVAPCTAVRDFQGRFDAFVATSGNRCEKFNFVFRFAWGDRQVGITLVRRAEAQERIYVVVTSGAL